MKLACYCVSANRIWFLYLQRDYCHMACVSIQSRWQVLVEWMSEQAYICFYYKFAYFSIAVRTQLVFLDINLFSLRNQAAIYNNKSRKIKQQCFFVLRSFRSSVRISLFMRRGNDNRHRFICLGLMDKPAKKAKPKLECIFILKLHPQVDYNNGVDSHARTTRRKKEEKEEKKLP